MSNVLDLSLIAAADAIRRREISATELTRLCLVRIEQENSELNAFLHVEAEFALEAARAADRTLARDEAVGALHGIPVARKDNLQRMGQLFTSGSRVFARRLGEFTAHCLTRIDAAGAVDLGGTNMSEFAFHVHGFNSLTGPPRNPWDLSRSAGGSSGGAAAAVAARLAFGAIGSDSGGSIRSPAALCGIVGLAPTPGLINTQGMAPGSATLDRVGPMARTVADCARLLSVLAGGDPSDARSGSRLIAGYESELERPVRGLRLGILRDLPDLNHDTSDVLSAAAAVFRDLGCEPVEIRLSGLDTLNALAMRVFGYEAAASHRDVLRDRAADIHPEVRERLLRGATVSAEDYRSAIDAAENERQEFLRTAFAHADALLLPAAPSEKPDKPDQGTATPAIDPGRYTRAFNYLGMPALVLPMGFDATGLPLGMQLVGKRFDEALLLNLGHQYQLATDWHLRKPSAAGARMPKNQRLSDA